MNAEEASRRFVVQSLRTTDGIEKFQRAAGGYIRNKSREACLPDAVLPPRPVFVDDMFPGLEEEDMHVLLDTPEDARSIYHGGEGAILESKRYAVPIMAARTDLYERTQMQIAHQGWNLLQILEDAVYSEALAIRTAQFFDLLNLAVAATGQVESVKGLLSDDDYDTIKHPDPENEEGLSPPIVLMSEAAYADCEELDGSYRREWLDKTHVIRSIQSRYFDTWDKGDTNSLRETAMWLFFAAQHDGTQSVLRRLYRASPVEQCGHAGHTRLRIRRARHQRRPRHNQGGDPI